MMLSKRGNFFGVLLALLMFGSILALFTSNPQTTGFVVQEAKQYKEDIAVNQNDNVAEFCSDNTKNGECSSTKPLICNNGNLYYSCYKCGCPAGTTCSEFGICDPIQKCADGSIYGECSFLKGKFCQDGTLVDNCNLCGCEEGKVCSNNRCVSK